MTPDQIEQRRIEADHRKAIAEQEAEAARVLMESPTLQKAFKELAALYTATWRGTAIDEVAKREDAWLMMRALEQVHGHLKAKIAGGNVAAFNLRGALAAKQRSK
jgi:hypothetical protein